jgi:RNA-directed DNA polymerase
MKTFIRDTYSSLKNRGIHDGVRRIKRSLRDKENTKFCLKFDIQKFYPSIDNEILKSIIREKIKDKALLWLLDEIIDSTTGVPIGNYLS